MYSIKKHPCFTAGVSVSQLLNIQHFCHFVEDFGVVVVTVEFVSIDTISKNSNGQTSVAVRGEGDTGLVVQDMSQSNRQRIVSAVHHILSLGILAGFGAVDALLEGHTQLLQLIGGQNQLVIRFSFDLQTEQSLDVSQSFLESGAFFLVSSSVLIIELLERNLLALQQGQVSIIVGTSKTDGQTAGFMVACNDDQSLVGMILCEVDGNLNATSSL